MKTEKVGNHTIITAEEGYFLANEDMTVYGVTLSLGTNDSPENYTEHPLSEMPVIEEPEVLEPLTEEEKEQLELLLKRKEANNQ